MYGYTKYRFYGCSKLSVLVSIFTHEQLSAIYHAGLRKSTIAFTVLVADISEFDLPIWVISVLK